METQGPIKLGGSLLVPSVQELVKQSLVEVPARYIRNDQDPLTDLSDASMTDQMVPVINLQNLVSPGPIGMSELERLHSACKEWGFFQLVNHGIDILLVERMKSEVEGFFNLPMDEKKKFWQEEGDLEGFGQAFVQSEDQKLDWSDMFFMLTLPQHMRKPRLFPKLPLPLRETIESYTSELRKLGLTLIEFMGKALQIETRVMAEYFEQGRQTIKLNYYPPCPQPENVIGVTPHSDSGGLTLLLILNELDGLEIRKENIWIPIKPLPNAFIVNVGDIMEIMSNGIYRSIEHRVKVNSTKERISVAVFQNPTMKSEIGPVLGMITPDTPAMFRTVVYEEYLRIYYKRTLDGKAYLDYMKTGEGDKDNKAT